MWSVEFSVITVYLDKYTGTPKGVRGGICPRVSHKPLQLSLLHLARLHCMVSAILLRPLSKCIYSRLLFRKYLRPEVVINLHIHISLLFLNQHFSHVHKENMPISFERSQDMYNPLRFVWRATLSRVSANYNIEIF